MTAGVARTVVELFRTTAGLARTTAGVVRTSAGLVRTTAADNNLLGRSCGTDSNSRSRTAVPHR